MNVMTAFTKKSLLANKKRTIVTIVGVIISVAMLTAVPTFIVSFLSMLQKSEVATNGDWHARISNVAFQNLNAIEQNKDIGSIVLSQNPGVAELAGSINKQKPYLYFQNYGENGYTRMSVHLKSGRLPQKAGEVVISETVQSVAGVSYSIGDTLNVTLGKREKLSGEPIVENASLAYQQDKNGNATVLDEQLVPGKTQSFTIVGIMQRPSFESSWSAGCGVLGYLDSSALSAADKVDVYVSAKNIDRSIFPKVSELAKQAGVGKENIGFNNDLLRFYGVVSSDTLFSFLMTFSAIIIFIIVLASVSLIYNAFAISVSERGKQLGLLSSVGATKRQKRHSVYYEALFIGSIGIPAGILAGVGGIGITLSALAPLLKDTFNTSTDMSLSLIVSPLAIAFAFVLSVITIFISVYIPARRASKIMPIDAIRQTGEIKLTRKAVKTSRLTRKLFGFEAEIALKNLKRSRKKYRATIVSLVISLVLFLTVSTYISMTQNLSGAMEYGMNYDISVTALNGNTAALAKAAETIASMPHVSQSVQTTELTRSARLSDAAFTDLTKKFRDDGEHTSGDFRFAVVVLDQNAFSQYAKAAGTDPAAYINAQETRAILINHGQEYLYNQQKKAYIKQSGDILTLKPGDAVGLYDADNSGIESNVKIGAVTDARPMGTLIQGFGSATLVMPDSAFQKAFSKEIPDGLRHAVYLMTDDDQALENQIASLSGAESNLRIYNIHSAARAERSTSTFLGVFIYGFITLISLICIANIFNTVSTNIALRRKEFAMLRSVGMTPKGFSRMIRFESVFYGLKGLLYGLPISVAIAYLLFGQQQSVLGSQFSLPYTSYAFAVLMILVIVFTTMLYSTSRIKKENIIDALKQESF